MNSNRLILLWHIRLWVFIYYFAEMVIRKRQINPYFRFLMRLNRLLGCLNANKIQKRDHKVRLGLYIPDFPSKAFETACNKFQVFDRKMNCTTALISVTSTCPYHCPHCYQRYDKGQDCNLSYLIDACRYLQDHGIAFFNIEGGEPFIRFDRLLALCKSIDHRSEIWVNSTGYGITEEKIQKLKQHIRAIMFSLHTTSEHEFNTFMGMDTAFSTFIRSLEICRENSTDIAFNCCLHEDSFENGEFEKIMDFARKYQALYVQLIRPKRAGAALSKSGERFSNTRTIIEKVRLYNHHPKYTDYPPISAQIIEESPEVFGCTAGGTDRFYINAKGDVQPCEFLQLSYGNIREEPFEEIYRRMRKDFEQPGSNWLCEQCASQISSHFDQAAQQILPLNPKQSKIIMSQTKRGMPGRVYKDS